MAKKKAPKDLNEDELDTEVGAQIGRRSKLQNDRFQAETMIARIDAELAQLDFEVTQLRLERKGRG